MCSRKSRWITRATRSHPLGTTNGCANNTAEIHPIAVAIFQFGPKQWIDSQTDILRDMQQVWLKTISHETLQPSCCMYMCVCVCVCLCVCVCVCVCLCVCAALDVDCLEKLAECWRVASLKSQTSQRSKRVMLSAHWVITIEIICWIGLKQGVNPWLPQKSCLVAGDRRWCGYSKQCLAVMCAAVWTVLGGWRWEGLWVFSRSSWATISK